MREKRACHRKSNALKGRLTQTKSSRCLMDYESILFTIFAT